MSTPLWSQCLKYLQRELSTQDFNTWIRPLQVWWLEE
ncbi:MAG: DnaA N-terminal domain-containing protein [Thiotrichaceae bacterium]